MGNRQGQRTDLELVQDFAQVDAGTKTRDIAARKAGFGNPETYRQARTVTENASSPLWQSAISHRTVTRRRKEAYRALHPETGMALTTT